MTTYTLGRWLLVTIAIAGLVFATAAVSAHGTEPTVDQAAPVNGTADEWATWMEAHMTDHMGPGSVDWMESHMGVTVEEMGQYMADADNDSDWPYAPGSGTWGPGVGPYAPANGTYSPGYGMYGGGMHGPGYGMYGPSHGAYGGGMYGGGC